MQEKTKMIKNLTRAQVAKICNENSYVVFREKNNSQTGINCRLSKINQMITKYNELDPNEQTNYCSYRPVDLMEYLTYKIPFTK